MTDHKAKSIGLVSAAKMALTILPKDPELCRIYRWLRERQGQPVSLRDFPKSSYRFSQIMEMLRGWVRWREDHLLVEGRDGEIPHIEKVFYFWGFQ